MNNRFGIETQPPWGCAPGRRFPRVARASQPWALGRNPVGIPGLGSGVQNFFGNLLPVFPLRLWRMAAAWSLLARFATIAASAGLLEIRNGYFWDAATGEYEVPR